MSTTMHEGGRSEELSLACRMSGVLIVAALVGGGVYLPVNLLVGGTLIGAAVISLALLATSGTRTFCVYLSLLTIAGGVVGLAISTPDTWLTPMGGSAVLCGTGLISMAILARQELPNSPTGRLP